MAKKKLGQGMSYLFEDNTEPMKENGNQMVRISSVEPNKNQPRTAFDDDAINALAESVRQHGVLQPILVRPLENGGYQIVAGERRWRAARIAGLDEVPVTVRELDDLQTAQIALVENLQREDLNPVEEALGYQSLVQKYSMTQNEVAQIVGKSRSSVTNSLRLLELDTEVKNLLEIGELTTGHCKALLAIENHDKQQEIAREIVIKKLSVRQTEMLVNKIKNELDGNVKTKAKDENFFKKPAFYSEVEISLKETLGQKVEVAKAKNGAPKMTISFKDDEALNEFLKRFS